MAKTKSTKTKSLHKVLIGFCSLVLLIVVLDIGINIWAKLQLNKIIKSENDSVYYVTVKNPSVSLLNSSISLEKIVFVPKASLKDSIHKDGIYGTVDKLKIEGFSLLNLLFNDKLKATSVTVENPTAILYQKKEKNNVRNSVAAPFQKTITVSDIFINHGNLKIIDVKTNTAVLSANNISFTVSGILITDKTLDEKIPLKFNNYVLNCDSLYYRPNEYYQIKTQEIKSSKADFNISGFKMLPYYSRREFLAKIPKEKDLYTLLCESIKINKIDWGFKGDDLFFHCNTIDLQNSAANIFRSKEPADDLTKKYLYNKLLRELDYDLKIDTLKVRNSKLEYEEEKSAEFGTGKLTLNALNLTATSIYSGYKKAELPDLKIKIRCQFMNASPLDVNWKLNVMDKSDGFSINGKLTNFDAEKIIPFTKPYMNVTTKGIIDELHFNIIGNDKIAKGELGVKYDDLKFTVYKKENPKKKNKLLTFVTKIFVKKDTKDKIKDAHIEVERVPEKSFYNLLCQSILQGLKKILV